LCSQSHFSYYFMEPNIFSSPDYFLSNRLILSPAGCSHSLGQDGSYIYPLQNTEIWYFHVNHKEKTFCKINVFSHQKNGEVKLK
jgi:hypothetical protein